MSDDHYGQILRTGERAFVGLTLFWARGLTLSRKGSVIYWNMAVLLVLQVMIEKLPRL